MNFRLLVQNSLPASASPYRLLDPQDREVAWANQFLDAQKLCQLSIRSLRAYAYDLLHLARWLKNTRHSLAKLNQSCLVQYVRDQVDHLPKPTAQTINHRLCVVRCLYRFHYGKEIPGKTHAEKWNALFQLCSEGYFGVVKIQFLGGRSFNEAEVNGARKLAVVNQTYQKKYLGNENPIGRQVRIAQLTEFEDPVKEPMFEIVGLVADAKNQGLQDPVLPEIWVPYTVTGSGFRGILVRTAGEPLAMMNTVQHEIWTTDPNVAITFTGTMEGYISQFSFAGPRFGFYLMTIFGGIGLVLVTLGVYSVLAYTTVRRTHEIGIRMALGAEGSDVQGMVIRMGLRLVGIGVGLGLIASVAIGRVIATQLWGVSAYDPWTLVCVPVVLLITGLVACWIPARRAARVDPLVALRYE